MVSSNQTSPRFPSSAACRWPDVGGLRCGTADGQPLTPLTQAEARVLFLIRQGLSNKEISGVLGRALPTIKNQVGACLRKYRVPSRTRLMVLAHEGE